MGVSTDIYTRSSVARASSNLTEEIKMSTNNQVLFNSSSLSMAAYSSLNESMTSEGLESALRTLIDSVKQSASTKFLKNIRTHVWAEIIATTFFMLGSEYTAAMILGRK